jgi:outer membrane protein OmpA-like peptidoglycan-associated protein
MKRAQTIADQLVKLGVNKANLTVEGKGGVATLDPASYNRRVIIEAM